MIIKNVFMKSALEDAKMERQNLRQERDFLLEQRMCGNAVLLLNEKILVLDGKIESLRAVIAEAKRYKVERNAKKLAEIAAQEEHQEVVETDDTKVEDNDTAAPEKEEEKEEEKKEVAVPKKKKATGGSKKKNTKKK